MSPTTGSPALFEARRPLTGPQSAALAKLTYAVAERHPLTLLCGPAGVGKTTVLRSLAEDIAARGQPVRLVSWMALRGGSNEHLGVAPTADRHGEEDDGELVLLVDDGHRAKADELAEFVEQWWWHDGAASIVMAGGGRLLSLVAGDARLEHAVRLRATLPSFTLAETRRLLAPTMADAATEAEAEDVIRTIHEIAGGAPAAAIRLAEMMAVLAQAEPRCPLTLDDVETIHRRLSLHAA